MARVELIRQQVPGYRIALIWNGALLPYGGEAIRGIAEYVSRQAGSIDVVSNRTGGLDVSALQSRRDISGIIVYQNAHEVSSIEPRRDVPVVSLEPYVSRLTQWQVQPDDASVGRLVAEEFLRRGFRKLAYCPSIFANGPADQAKWDTDRLSGFALAADHAAAELHVYPGPPESWGNLEREWTGRLADWIRSLPKPSGLMAANDQRAQHVAYAAAAAGVGIPRDIALIGVDNQIWSEFPGKGGISSVVLDGYSAGYEAAKMVHGLMAGREAPDRIVRIPPRRLITRQSSDILAVNDPDLVAALRFIADNITTGIGVEQVVQAVPLSRRALERRFQSGLHHSIMDEIHWARVERARKLLPDDSIPLRRVARLCGFESTDVFSRTFHRVAGVTPSRYRVAAVASLLEK